MLSRQDKWHLTCFTMKERVKNKESLTTLKMQQMLLTATMLHKSVNIYELHQKL